MNAAHHSDFLCFLSFAAVLALVTAVLLGARAVRARAYRRPAGTRRAPWPGGGVPAAARARRRAGGFTAAAEATRVVEVVCGIVFGNAGGVAVAAGFADVRRASGAGHTGDHSRAWMTRPDQSAPWPLARWARLRMPFDNQLLGRTADAASALVARISASSRSRPRIAAEAW